MKIIFDPIKYRKNAYDQNLPFDCAVDFEWETAIYIEDNRFVYPERRFLAMAYLSGRLHVLCFTPVENSVRIISFGKANTREVKKYEKDCSEKSANLKETNPNH